MEPSIFSIFDAAEAPENVLLRQLNMVPTMFGAAGARGACLLCLCGTSAAC